MAREILSMVRLSGAVTNRDAFFDLRGSGVFSQEVSEEYLVLLNEINEYLVNQKVIDVSFNKLGSEKNLEIIFANILDESKHQAYSAKRLFIELASKERVRLIDDILFPYMLRTKSKSVIKKIKEKARAIVF